MKEKTYPSEKLDKFMLRFPDGMRDDIRDAAEAAGRSMNAEIIHRLQHSFDGPNAMPENLLEQILRHKDRKQLESDSVELEDIGQILFWIGDVQNYLIKRLLDSKAQLPDEHP